MTWKQILKKIKELEKLQIKEGDKNVRIKKEI